MAGSPQLAVLLVGLGIDELSVSASSLLTVKRILRSISFADARGTADAVLKMKSGPEIRDYITAKTAEFLKKGGT